ncbi:MAG: hypothetical protein JJU15_14635 [Pararhodobacter sp.]|nr:hypothetical protein [Pararhodobacter sp.]
MSSMFSARFRYCLSNIFSLSRYTDILLLRTISTHLHVVRFVGKVWRRNDWKFIVGGLVVGFLAFLYDQISQSASENYHWIAQSMTWLGFGTSFIVAANKLTNLHKSRIFGTKREERLTLTRRFFMELPPDGSPPPHFTIHDIVSPDTATQIITIGREDRPINRAALDLTVSKALLSDQKIAILPAPDGSLMNGNMRSVMELTDEKFSDDQVEALQIMRRDAINKRTSFFDSPKISLKSIGVDERGALVSRIGETSYFATCLTNDLATQSFAHPDGSLERYSPINMFPAIVAQDGKSRVLCPISDRQSLSNHVGSVVLAISRDGIPVLCFQGQGARINSGKVVLSGAGSIDLADLAHSQGEQAKDLGRVIRYGMARELLEETGGIPQDTNREEDFQRLRDYLPRIHLAGYYRDLRRGGLPIFVGFCRMEQNFDIIESRKHESLCLFRSPVETRVIDKLVQRSVSNAVEMLEYLETHIRGNAKFRCDPSDQLLLMREILRVPLMQQHFNTAISVTAQV